jgi:hypothetical protein
MSLCQSFDIVNEFLIERTDESLLRSNCFEHGASKLYNYHFQTKSQFMIIRLSHPTSYNLKLVCWNCVTGLKC